MAKNLSTFAVARMLHVDPGSVANWIDQGLLKAHRTPGGHRRVTREDLISFLREHKMPVPKELQDQPMRVLVVDDNESVTRLIARAVRDAFDGCEVIEANDGFRAGNLVASLHPDVVILDLRMPGMDGYEVCRLIKSQEATKNTEVVAVTAYSDEEDIERILRSGARVCLPKPLDMDNLLNEVRRSL